MVRAGSDLDSCFRFADLDSCFAFLHSCMSEVPELWERPLTQTLGKEVTSLIVAFAIFFDPRARRQCYTVFYAQDGEPGSTLWYWQLLNRAIRRYRSHDVMESNDLYENIGLYLGCWGEEYNYYSAIDAEHNQYMMSFNAFREERLGRL